MRNGLLILASLGLAACGGKASDQSSGSSVGPLAPSLTVGKVASFQGVEKVLYSKGGAGSGGLSPVPLVAGRDTMVRVHVRTNEDFEPRTIRGLLNVVGEEGATPFVADLYVSEEGSNQGQLESTLVFDVPGALISKSTELEVSLHDLPGVAVSGDLVAPTWTSGSLGSDVEPSDTLRIVIVPIRYDGDGSGRLPDLSEETLASLEDELYAAFPAAAIEIEVDKPLPWPSNVSANGAGWDTLLGEMSARRQEAAQESSNTYYYGMFKPAPKQTAYCEFGCVLGLSLLAQQPGWTWAQASIGTDFPDSDTVATLIHEVGHAHGRAHAPCGLGGQESDPGFPYGGGFTGTWGYNLRTAELYQPDSFDVMSYCAPYWISDYTFTALHQRIRDLKNITRASGARGTWSMHRVYGDGTTELLRTTEVAGIPGGEVRRVRGLFDAELELEGQYLPYDHIEGGVLWVPNAVDSALILD